MTTSEHLNVLALLILHRLAEEGVATKVNGKVVLVELPDRAVARRFVSEAMRPEIDADFGMTVEPFTSRRDPSLTYRVILEVA